MVTTAPRVDARLMCRRINSPHFINLTSFNIARHTINAPPHKRYVFEYAGSSSERARYISPRVMQQTVEKRKEAIVRLSLIESPLSGTRCSDSGQACA
jgi:hypothetical protein